jgi:hypothetical protein
MCNGSVSYEGWTFDKINDKIHESMYLCILE